MAPPPSAFSRSETLLRITPSPRWSHSARTGYRIEAAYDDARQVFIEFPRGIAQDEMPPLFVVGTEGDTSELVNYRVRNNYMIVDRFFAAVELRYGSGDRQKRVRISRTDGRPAS